MYQNGGVALVREPMKLNNGRAGHVFDSEEVGRDRWMYGTMEISNIRNSYSINVDEMQGYSINVSGAR